MRIIGLMSGTSADGIDAALVDVSGRRRLRVRIERFLCLPHPPELREAILRQCAPDGGRTAELCALNAVLGERFAEAAQAVAKAAGVPMESVRAIASHGQTVWHQPEPIPIGGGFARGTLQIGEPAVIAARTGRMVVSGFRAADMAAGGQGAPLVPFADWALLSSPRENRAVQNLGGIGNVTWLPAGGGPREVIAFDTGPGCMVIDSLSRALSDGRLQQDEDGAWAASGSADPDLLQSLVEHPYFACAPPKSTGRELFGEPFVRSLLHVARVRRVDDADLMATATALTAESIARAYRNWLAPRGAIHRVIVGGGGARNLTLMRMLSERLAPSVVVTSDDLGIPSDAKEAVAFAVLAHETLHGRPSSIPTATGAVRATVLGSITPPPEGGPLSG